MAKRGEFGLGTVEELDVDQRKDLGRGGGRRLAAASSAQHTALDARVPREDGEDEVTVAKRMVVENQGFIFNHRHMLMVAERQRTRLP